MELQHSNGCSVLAIGFVASCAAFGSVFNGFTWDDRAAVLENRDAQVFSDPRPEDSLLNAFFNDFWGTPIGSEKSHKSYRPITVLSFRLNNWLYGFDSYYYHLVNLAVHVATSLLVWQITRLCFDQLQAQRRARARARATATATAMTENTTQHQEASMVGALIAGLLFAVHPIHCDAVASIVGRADLLATCFSLLGFVLYLQATEHSGRTSWTRFVLALVCVVLATLSKELGFTTIGLFVAFDLIHFAVNRMDMNQDASRQALHQLLFRLGAMILFSIPAACLRVWMNGEYHHHEWHYLANHIARQPKTMTKLLSYAHVHAWYLFKLFWPSSLCFDYGFSSIPMVTSLGDPNNGFTLMAYALVVGGTFYAVKHIRKVPELLLFICFGLIPFVPASHVIFPVGTILAERLLYFPSVGFCTLCAWMFQRVIGRTQELQDHHETSQMQKAVLRTCHRVMWLSLALLVGAGVVRSHVRNLDWQSETQLFESAVRVHPRNVKVLSNVAKVMLNQDPDRAIRHARVALALFPKQVEGHINLGLGYSNKLDQLSAVDHLHKAARFSKMDRTSLGSLGKELFALWTHERVVTGFTQVQFKTSPTILKATSFLDLAIAKNTFHPSHYQARGLIAYHSGEFDQALDFFLAADEVNEFVRTLQTDPELVLPASDLINMIGATYQSMGRLDLAMQTFEDGLARFPDQMDFVVNTAIMFKLFHQEAKCEQLLLDATSDFVSTMAEEAGLEEERGGDEEEDEDDVAQTRKRNRWHRLRARDFVRIGSALESSHLDFFAVRFYAEALLVVQPMSPEYQVWFEQKLAKLRPAITASSQAP